MKKLLSFLFVISLLFFYSHTAFAGPYQGPHVAIQAHKVTYDPCIYDGVNLYVSTIQGNYSGANVIKVDLGLGSCVTPPIYDLTTITPAFAKGTYYLIATAYTTAGAESGPSNEVIWPWDPTIPNPPAHLLVK